jgi:outer membrane murein-binding lipoprotein Lpp
MNRNKLMNNNTENLSLNCTVKKEDELVKQIRKLNAVIEKLQLKNSILQTEIYKTKQTSLRDEKKTINDKVRYHNTTKTGLRHSNSYRHLNTITLDEELSLQNDSKLEDITLQTSHCVNYKEIVDKLIKLTGVDIFLI